MWPRPWGEEERVGVLCDEVIGGAAQDAGVDQSGGDGGGGLEVEGFVFDAGLDGGDGFALGGEDDFVEVALQRGEGGGDGEGAGDVAGVAADFGAGVDQDEFAVVEASVAGRAVQDGGVGAAADDGAVGGAVAAEAEEFGFHFDLDVALAEAGAGGSPGAEVTGDGGVDGAAQVLEFERVFGAAALGEGAAEALNGVFVDDDFEGGPVFDAVFGGALLDVAVAEQGDWPAAAGGEPVAERGEVVGSDAGSLGLQLGRRGLAHPDAILDGEGGSEEPPAEVGLPDERCAGFGDAGQVLEFGMGVEVVELVGAVDRDGQAGGDDDGAGRLVGEVSPGVGDAAAACLEQIGGGARVRRSFGKCTDGSGFAGDDLDEQLAFLDGGAGLAVDGGDAAGGGGGQQVLHFHGFEDDEGLAGVNGVAFGDEDGGDGAGHGGMDGVCAAAASSSDGGALALGVGERPAALAVGDDAAGGEALHGERGLHSFDAERDFVVDAAGVDAAEVCAIDRCLPDGFGADGAVGGDLMLAAVEGEALGGFGGGAPAAERAVAGEDAVEGGGDEDVGGRGGGRQFGAFEPADVDAAGGEVVGGEHGDQLGGVGAEAGEGGSFEGGERASAGFVAGGGVGDQLAQHGVVVGGDGGVLGDAEVKAEVVGLGRVEPAQAAGGGGVVVGGVFGVEAGFDGVSAPGDLVLGDGQGFAHGDAELEFDEVEAGEGFGDGVLDLEAGVDFEEDEFTVGQEEELDGAGVLVLGGAGDVEGGLAEAVAERLADVGRGGFFDDFLSSALDGAVALAEVDGVAVLVGEDLDFDVATVEECAFGEQSSVAEGGLGFAAGGGDGCGEVFGRGFEESHAATAAAGGGFEHDGVAELGDGVGEGVVAVVLLDAFGDGDAGGDGQSAGLGFVAELGHDFGRRADPGEAGVVAGLGELGVFGEEAVAGVDGVGVGLGGGVEQGGDVEVAVGGGCGADGDGGVGFAGVECVAVGVGVDGDGADAEFSAGAGDARGDFAAVGDQDGLGELHVGHWASLDSRDAGRCANAGAAQL